jgi:WXG100 family type VII secretion target
MAKIRKLNYDDMNSIVGKFKNEAQEIDALLKQTKGKVESLHNNQWVGQGSDKFFSDMEQLVLPAVARLVDALNHAADIAQKIAATIQQFDNDTKSFFNNLI